MRANRAGKAAEDSLAAILRVMGIVFERQVVLGRTIFEKRLRVDFVLLNLREFPNGLIIESKWQDVGGSIEEKFPYLVENIRGCYPLPAIVVVHGGGCSEGAMRWFRQRCDGKLIAVMTLEEFMSWALRCEKFEVRVP